MRLPLCSLHGKLGGTGVLALSGFRYDEVQRRIEIQPRVNAENFTSFWVSATGWGSFSQRIRKSGIEVDFIITHGNLRVRSAGLAPIKQAGRAPVAKIGNRILALAVQRNNEETVVQFAQEIKLQAGERLVILV